MNSYPRTINIDKWRYYLQRELQPYEFVILRNVFFEKDFNKKLNNLHNNCKLNNTYIPLLTNINGNCLLECLIYNDIGDNISDLRKSLSLLLYQYKDYKNFFNGRDETLEEIFTLTNDIEQVYCIETDTLNKYTYNVMCQDFCNNHSWDNLPGHLILLFLSQLFNLRFIIISDIFDKPTIIHAYENSEEVPELRDIYLGHIFENHYLPVIPIDDNYDENKLPTYNEAKKVFHQWGTVMADMINKYNDSKNIEEINE